VLQRQRQVLGDDHISTLKTRLELAIWTGQSGEDRDALLQLLDQRDDWIRVCGHDHPNTLRMLHILAQFRGLMGELSKANPEMRGSIGDAAGSSAIVTPIRSKADRIWRCYAES
jgi:hypothetical protein